MAKAAGAPSTIAAAANRRVSGQHTPRINETILLKLDEQLHLRNYFELIGRKLRRLSIRFMR